MGSSTWKVLQTYSAVRWYLLTAICKDVGDWLVRLSNLVVIQKWAGTGAALSHLVLSALLPKALFSPVGGLLADRFDRRHIMIALDALAGVVVLGFLIAVHYKSVTILFCVTAARSSIASIYYPVTHGLMPLMVPNAQDMQYASTMVTGVYGLMSMVGGLVAGSAAMELGLAVCYALDSATYFLSSLIMLFCVTGNFRRQFHENENDPTVVSVDSSSELVVEGKNRSRARCRSFCKKCRIICLDIVTCGTRKTFKYLATSGCAMLVFLKATDSLIWGPGDVVGVEIGTVRNADGSENEESTSYRMGLYYCFTGFGVFLGPMLANFISDAERPSTLQRACLIAMLVTMIGWLWAAYAPTFKMYLFSQMWSGIGNGCLWSYSSLLLQILVDNGILGRVLSIEYFLYVMAEAASSSATGPLYDRGLSTKDLCLFGAGLALVCLFFWTIYHICGGGAAHPNLNQLSDTKKFPGIKCISEEDDSNRTEHVPRSIEITPSSHEDEKSVARRKVTRVIPKSDESIQTTESHQRKPDQGVSTEEEV